MAPSPPTNRASKSLSNPREAFRLLGLPRNATIDEINHVFKVKLSDLQRKYSDKPDKLVQEADYLYQAYRCAFMSRENVREEQMLPLTITGPDSMLNLFGIQDFPQHQSVKVQSSSQAQYKDGQLVRKESNRTETFINKDGRRETKVYENDKLIKHTIDGKDMLS